MCPVKTKLLFDQFIILTYYIISKTEQKLTINDHKTVLLLKNQHVLFQHEMG